MVYKTSGVCSSAISFDIDDAGKVHDVKFQGGCSGNTQGVAKLIEGMDAKEAISRLEGIRCGFRPTSCPDQLSKNCSVYQISSLSHLSHSDWISLAKRSRSLFGMPSLLRITDIRRCPIATSFWNALAALLAFGEAEALVMRIPCAS